LLLSTENAKVKEMILSMADNNNNNNNNNNNKKIETIQTEQIRNDLWDARLKPEYNEKDESFLLLRENIRFNGLLRPRSVTPTNNKKGSYSIIDGRRRFEAMKQLKYKEIECYVTLPKTQSEMAVMSLIQNLHRKNLNDIERCTGIAEIFKMVGFSIDNVITNCKRIHNDKSTGNVDPVFVSIFKTIGYSANFTYQLMQLLKDMPLNVLKYAQKRGLTTQQKILLTHTKLREHPQLQMELVDELKNTKDIRASRVAIYQVIRDLETGALFKSGKSYHVHTHLRDKIDDRELEYAPYQNLFEILKHSNELLRFLTGHQLTKGEFEYNKNHVNYSAQHRIDIVKTLDSRTILALMEQLETLQFAIDAMRSVISGEVNQTLE
jgi:ParB/RepB/Spo0J family partition protein